MKKFSINARMRSFRYAFAGIATMVRTQHNAWIHAMATAVVCLLAALLDVSAVEWGLLILAVAVVWIAEALNTAFEFLCDVASPEFHPLVKKSKDVAAGAVLLAAIGAAAVGLLVFAPKLMALLR